jgi:hypothetical protein
LASGTVPSYSVTGTPPSVLVPTWRTPLAAWSSCESVSGLSLLAWLKSWVRLMPLLLLSVDTGTEIHGLLVCSCWVMIDDSR